MANEINFYRLAPQPGAQCAICYELFDAQDIAVGHAAGLTNHVYHQVCAQPWIDTHHNCPECRLPVRSIQLIAPPEQPRARAHLSLLARQHPYILNGTIAATTAAAIGTAVLQNSRFNARTLLGLVVGTYAMAPVESELDNRLQVTRKLVLAVLFCAAAALSLQEDGSPQLTPIMALMARLAIELPRLYPSFRMDPQHAPDLQTGLSLGLWSLMLATVDREDTREPGAAIATFVAASCLITLALTAYRRFLGPDAR